MYGRCGRKSTWLVLLPWLLVLLLLLLLLLLLVVLLLALVPEAASSLLPFPPLLLPFPLLPCLLLVLAARPWNTTLPWPELHSPAMVRSTEVLPAPEGPMISRDWPRSTCRAAAGQEPLDHSVHGSVQHGSVQGMYHQGVF
jgi:hypothetical protein